MLGLPPRSDIYGYEPIGKNPKVPAAVVKLGGRSLESKDGRHGLSTPAAERNRRYRLGSAFVLVGAASQAQAIRTSWGKTRANADHD